MPRTITVKGVGKVVSPVDYVEISMTITNTDKDYAKACELTDNAYLKLKNTVVRSGFKESSLKTTNYNVHAEYSGSHNAEGKYIKEFVGFNCTHSLKLSFSFSNELLSKAVNALFSSLASPDIDIRFTVENKDKLKAAILRSAAASAKENALTLCEASDVKLGSLLSVTYSDDDINVYSTTSSRFMANGTDGAVACASLEVNPDDVVTKDTVTFVWEIA